MTVRNVVEEFEKNNLPDEWIRTNLDNLSLIILGQSPPSSTYNKEQNGLPFFQGKTDFGDIHPTARVWCNAPKKIAEKDDILISVRAPVGSTNISKEKCGIGRGLSAIRSLDKINQKYVFYQLRFLENHISQKGTGTTFKAITGSQLKSIMLALAPPPEQKRIVSKIESIFSQIDAAKMQLEALASQTKSASGSLSMLKSSVLKQAFEGKLVPQNPKDESAEILLKKIHKDSDDELVFEKENIPKGWVMTNLENIVEILDRRRIPVNSSERKNRKGSIPYYGATGQVGWIDDHLFDEELVLLGEDGAPFFEHYRNKAYMINGKSWVNNHAHVLKGMSKLLVNQFLCNYLNQIDYHPYVTGTTRLKLNQTVMKTIPVILPPLNEQKRIVSKIESIFDRIDAINFYIIVILVFIMFKALKNKNF